jgi:hypothetical protein
MDRVTFSLFAGTKNYCRVGGFRSKIFGKGLQRNTYAPYPLKKAAARDADRPHEPFTAKKKVINSPYSPNTKRANDRLIQTRPESNGSISKFDHKTQLIRPRGRGTPESASPTTPATPPDHRLLPLSRPRSSVAGARDPPSSNHARR